MALSTSCFAAPYPTLTPHSEALGMVHRIHLLQNCHHEGGLEHGAGDHGTVTGTAPSTIYKRPNMCGHGPGPVILNI